MSNNSPQKMDPTQTLSQPETFYLKDYAPPDYWVDSVDLVFDLYQDKALVHSTLRCRRNSLQKGSEHAALVLNGEALKLKSLVLQDKTLDSQAYFLNEQDHTLTIKKVPEEFTLKITTEIQPQLNTELSGLYRSNALFCTQCEAQGFRRITYYPDRPDVMAKFTTTIHADKRLYPVLLSNGNCVAKGDEGDRHWVTWEDPFKKPSYLFALVAGDLVAIEDHFLTRSNRLVTLKIYVETENQDKCAHAMRALKQAMLWDEQTYGREYDLDIYMIVAVNDFNMGAMENKGLNIFNAKYILARPETATDADFGHIDLVVGHEYFHNWSGNRITCRDWFQLSLKEGLTVFREQHFTQDITRSAVSLINTVNHLRSTQFPEDAGPMAHPVRPESYVEINNFYTSTVYEKGAEVIRMLRTLLGPAVFREGMDLYFERYDGQAVTTDDFVAAMEAVSKRDLTQFKLWYSQAGTPEITVQGNYDEVKQCYTLTLQQYCPATPHQTQKLPLHIPIAIGLLDSKGQDILPEKTKVLELRDTQQSFSFHNVTEPPVLSLLRDFSAPVKIKTDLTEENLAFLLAHDSDAFNRWDAGQTLSERFIFKLVNDHQQQKPFAMDATWLAATYRVLQDKTMDVALKTEVLTLPSLTYLLSQKERADIDGLTAAKKYILREMATAWSEELEHCYEDNKGAGQYVYTTEAAAKRTFKNFCLNLLTTLETPESIVLAQKQWQTANNMTDAIGALYSVLDIECSERQQMLDEFYERGKHDPLLLNKWLRAQAMSDLPNTLTQVKKLTQHPDFDIKNPNKVYALIGGFAGGNPVRFHDKSGEGYVFLADTIIQLDKMNPQVASRMMEPFTHWKKFDIHRKNKMEIELKRIQAEPKLSKDVYEILKKTLA